MVTFNGMQNQQLYMILNKPISRRTIAPGHEYDAFFHYVNSKIGQPVKVTSLSMPINDDGDGVVITVTYDDKPVCLFCWRDIDCNVFFGDLEGEQ